MSDRESGYLIKAKIWVPADPQDPESMATAARWMKHVRRVSELDHGIAQLEIVSPPRFHARRTVPELTGIENPEETSTAAMRERIGANEELENDPPIPPDPAEMAARRVPRPAPVPIPPDDPDFAEPT